MWPRRSGSRPAAIGSDTPAATGVFRSDASARSACQEASRMARSETSSRLVGAHVVAAVAQMEHGTATRALTVMGIGRAALAATAREEIDGQVVKARLDMRE
jgi:hypothetical protein